VLERAKIAFEHAARLVHSLDHRVEKSGAEHGRAASLPFGSGRRRWPARCRSIAELPPGFYNVTFGPTVWKSVEVKAGETTLIDPGVLEVRTAWVRGGHKVLDWETEEEVGALSTSMRRITVVPSTFTVTFGNARWEHIDVKAGEHKLIDPAVIVVKGLDHKGGKVNMEDGTFVANVTTSAALLPVPPGKYVLEVADRKVPLDLAEGQRMEINLR